MNDYSRELMHMTTAEKAAYNRKYYQSHKDYWVEYYKLGQKRKGRRTDGLDVHNEAEAFYNRKMIDDARLASKPIRTNQTSTYGISSKSRYKIDPRLRYADEYQKHIRPRSIASAAKEKKPVRGNVKLSENGYKDRDQKFILRDRYDWEENQYVPTRYSKNFYEDRMNRPRQVMIPNPNYEKEQSEKERERLKKHIRDAAPWISEPALDVIARTGHQVYTTVRSYINSIPDLKKSLSGALGQASSRVKPSIDTRVKWLKSKWG